MAIFIFNRSYRKSISLLIFFGVSWISAHSTMGWAETQCEVTSLTFTPYSSSYAPLFTGPIVNERGATASLEGHQLSAEQLEIYNALTIMQRLDLLVGDMDGVNPGHQRAARRTHYQPEKPPWSGFCHQWSSAALDPTVNRLIDEIGDITCNGITITKSEVRELFTAFYPFEPSDQLGIRSDEKPNQNERAFQLYAGGLDRLQAVDFDAFTLARLSSQKGFVINAMNAVEVWNQPVYSSKRCVESKAQDQIRAQDLPVSFVQSRNPAIQSWLYSVSHADQKILDAYERVGNHMGFRLQAQMEADYRQAGEKLISDFKKLGTELYSESQLDPKVRAAVNHVLDEFKKPDVSYAQAREALYRFTAILDSAGLIQPEEGREFELVRNTLTYKKEVDFAEPASKSEARTYSYVLIRDKQDHRLVGSYWTMDNSLRPGFLWTPQVRSPVSGYHPINRSPVLTDLLRVSEQCKKNPNFVQRNLRELKTAAKKPIILPRGICLLCNEFQD